MGRGSRLIRGLYGNSVAQLRLETVDGSVSNRLVGNINCSACPLGGGTDAYRIVVYKPHEKRPLGINR